MRLSHLRAVFDAPGPFATVYVRTSRDAATAGHQVRLGARHLAEQLTAQGAPPEAGQAIENAVIDETGGALPDLYAYVRAYANNVPHVVAVVDRVGGDLTAVDALGDVREIESVDGTTFHLRKVKAGDWANLHYLHQAEERWKANAEDVAAAVERLIDDVRAEALVLAGDVRAREKLHGKLSERSLGLLSEIEHGGRADGVDDGAFDAAVHETLDGTVRNLVSERYDMFAERLGKGGAAAQGLSDGAVPAPVSAALLRCAVLTDAKALAVPYEHPTLRDGIGALLRF